MSDSEYIYHLYAADFGFGVVPLFINIPKEDIWTLAEHMPGETYKGCTLISASCKSTLNNPSYDGDAAKFQKFDRTDENAPLSSKNMEHYYHENLIIEMTYSCLAQADNYNNGEPFRALFMSLVPPNEFRERVNIGGSNDYFGQVVIDDAISRGVQFINVGLG